jgi:hypothetical protein
MFWDVCPEFSGAMRRRWRPRCRASRGEHPWDKTHALQPLDRAIFHELKARAVDESAKLGKTPVKGFDALRPFLAA